MVISQGGRSSLLRCLCNFLWVSTIFLIFVKAQETDLQINGVRLQPNSTDVNNNIKGTVQLLTNNWRWVHISTSFLPRALSTAVGEVLCRQLGYGKYGGSTGTTKSNNSDTISDTTWNCNGSENSLNECMKRSTSQTNFNNVISITCAESKCTKENGECAQICYNNPVDPSVECGCWPGYVISSSSPNDCVDVDECLENNGGCTGSCINTIGSYHCTCSIYAHWDNHTRRCVEFGSTVVCDDDGMTAAFLKQAYPMIHIRTVSLLDYDCRARENATHYIFETKYDKCMTTKEATPEGYKYSNAITSTAKDGSVGLVGFSSLIHITFSCLINKTNFADINLKPESILLKSVAKSDFDPAIRLSLCDDQNCRPTQMKTNFKQADVLYARLSLISQDYDIKLIVKDCKVYEEDRVNTTYILLIANGTSNMDWVEIIEPSGWPDFVFRFPAFTLHSNHKSLKLKCSAVVTPLSPNEGSNGSAVFVADSTTAPLLANKQKGNDYPLIYSCDEAKHNGIYRLVASTFVIKVWCDVQSQDGPWLTFMRRNNSGLNFTKQWTDYEEGFGQADGEFWLGNKFLHLLTKDQPAALRISLTTFSNATSYTDYNLFQVADSLGKYQLTIDRQSGSAGDMRNASGCSFNGNFQLSANFSTYDQDNDNIENFTCAKRGGGWWYFDCNCTCLTCGPSVNGAAFTRKGMIYYPFNDLYVLKASEMKLRFPKLARDSNFVIDHAKSVQGSYVSCDMDEMLITLKRAVFEQPGAHNWTVQTDTFISQSYNATHFMLKFRLRGADTTRQIYSKVIEYKKEVTIAPQFSQYLKYYSQLDMTMICSAKRNVDTEISYTVEAAELETHLEETGLHHANLRVFKDDVHKTQLIAGAHVSEGDPVFVKVIPVHAHAGIRLVITSCSALGISNADNAVRLIQNRCPVIKDVHMTGPDSFTMRAFSLKDSISVQIACEVEACSANNADCFAACDDTFRKRRHARSTSAVVVALSPRLLFPQRLLSMRL